MALIIYNPTAIIQAFITPDSAMVLVTFGIGENLIIKCYVSGF